MRMVIAVIVMTLLLVISTLALETERAIKRFFVTEIALHRLSVNSFQDDAMPVEDDDISVQELTDVALGLSFEELAYLGSQVSTPKLITSEQRRKQVGTLISTSNRQIRHYPLMFDLQRGLAM